MQSLGVSYTGNPDSRVGIDINNLGQVVVTSDDGTPYIYQDGNLTNLNDLLEAGSDADAGYVLTEAKGINDSGYIIAQGTLSGNDRGFLLIPQFLSSNENTIKVGNISTFGESVLLEGEEIHLGGESIVTQGGDNIYTGKTFVNNNLVIDSSITDESTGNPNADSIDSDSGMTFAGGDITFTDILNSKNTGEQSLTIKAGAGDVLFENLVGNTAPIFDLAIESAGSVTAIEDITVDNELRLDVINDVATENIAAQGLVDISLGQ